MLCEDFFPDTHTHIYTLYIYIFWGGGLQYKMYFLLWVIPKNFRKYWTGDQARKSSLNTSVSHYSLHRGLCSGTSVF